MFNVSIFHAKTKIQKMLLRDLLIDDAVITTHTVKDLQMFIDCFATACNTFDLASSQKKTQMVGQNTGEPVATKIVD